MVNQFGTPVSLQKIGWKMYIVFTLWVAFEDLFVYWYFHETANYSLEELDVIFASPSPKKASTRRREVFVDDNET